MTREWKWWRHLFSLYRGDVQQSLRRRVGGQSTEVADMLLKMYSANISCIITIHALSVEIS